MSISARDQKVRVLLFGDLQQLFSAESLLFQQYFGARLDAVLGQVISNVLKSRQRRSLFARPTRFDDDDLGCLLQKRYRITHSVTGPAGIFPADNDTLSPQSAVRHRQRRTSQLQNRLGGGGGRRRWPACHPRRASWACREDQWPELRSGLLLLAMTFIALPIMPGDPIGPFGGVNPREVWIIAIVLARASFNGYVAVNYLAASRGVLLAAAAGGLVSSTAVTARRAAVHEGPPELLAAGVSVATAVSFLRVFAIAAALQPSLLLEVLLGIEVLKPVAPRSV